MRNRRWVIKIGSGLLVSGGPILLRTLMSQVAELKKQGIEIIWVTSGAIASAKEHLRLKSKKIKSISKLSEKQALSAIGQPLVMDLYNLALGSLGLQGAQILLTYDDLVHSGRRKNLQNTLETLLRSDCVPILNENDAVATDEIRFGDNDSLSAKVAKTMKADRLVILTDVEGLYDKNPSKNPSAKLIARVSKIDTKILKMAGKRSGSKHGTGGMLSKLLAGREAANAKIETVLVKGDTPSALLKLLKEPIQGTVIEVKK